MSECILSIIIPAWNAEQYIFQCVSSCIGLKIDTYEIIVVDDGSTDGTADTIKREFSAVNNLFLFQTENKGLSCARNYGIEKATGKYIVFLDADDWINGSINVALEKIDEVGLDVIFFAARDVYEDGVVKEQHKYPFNEGEVVSGQDVIKTCNRINIQHEAWRGIYNKEFLMRHNIVFLEGIIYEDNAFWFRVMRYAQKLMYTNRVIYNYRMRTGSIVHSETNRTKVCSVLRLIEDIILVDDLYIEYLSTAIWKILVLIQGCERKVSTKRWEDIFDYDTQKWILERKKNIFNRLVGFGDESYERLKQIYYFMSHIAFCFGVYDENILKTTLDLRERIINQLAIDMSKWPLAHSDAIVGVYGSGRDADVLLDTYIRIVGEIKAKYLYIDSNKESFLSKHLNRPIINVKDIADAQITDVIIGSRVYQKSMTETVSNLFPFVNVYSIYSDNCISLEGLVNLSYVELYLELKKTENRKRIILIGTPEYPNIGDHLICIAEKQFFSKFFSEYTIVEITSVDYWIYKSRIKNLIKDEDILVITGGGFIGSLWTEGHYDEVLDVLEGYKNNRVIIMPQSAYFDDDKVGCEYKKLTEEAFERNNVLFFCREKLSYNTMFNLIRRKDAICEAPDIALFYKYSRGQRNNNGIGIFFRNDKESIISEEKKQKYISYLRENGNHIILSSMQYHAEIMRIMRDYAVKEKLNEIRQYKCVITDQLHCMISCAIVGTPCIALNNVSRKLEGVYEWLKNQEYVKFVDSIEKLYDIDINYIVKQKVKHPVVSEKEWERLASKIREVLI